MSYTGCSFGWAGVLPFCRDAIGVFYSPSQLGHSSGESYHSAEMWSVYCTAPDEWATRWGSLTTLQRCNQCIVQPHPTGPLVGGVLPLCRDVIGVFYSPRRMGHALGESYHSAEIQSVYCTAPSNWATRRGSLTTLQRCNWCILQPQTNGPRVGGVLPLCRDTISVLYSPRRMGHSSGESYHSAEM